MSVSEAKNLKATMKYSKLFIGKSEELNIESIYTNVQILQVKKMQVNSKYDGYEIGEVDELLVDNNSFSLYTKFNINKLNSKLSLPAFSYGSLSVSNVLPQFESIVINARYASVKITLDAATSCKFEALVYYGKIQTNMSKANLSMLSTSNPKSVTGIIGESDPPKALIKIKSDYSNIIMKQL